MPLSLSWAPARIAWMVCRAFLADQAAQLVEQLALRRLSAIEEAGHRDHQHQDRRHREQRIEGQRGTLAGGTVRQPFRYRALHDVVDLEWVRNPLFLNHTDSPKKKKGHLAPVASC